MMLNKNFKCRKGRAPSVKKCYALNTSGGYISGGENPNRSIRAFGDPLVRARKAGV
jgi:hypothetical protein